MYRLSYTGMWNCVVFQVDRDDSEEIAVSVFMVEIISSFSPVYKWRRPWTASFLYDFMSDFEVANISQYWL
jgi:hypothetical protein